MKKTKIRKHDDIFLSKNWLNYQFCFKILIAAAIYKMQNVSKKIHFFPITFSLSLNYRMQNTKNKKNYNKQNSGFFPLLFRFEIHGWQFRQFFLKQIWKQFVSSEIEKGKWGKTQRVDKIFLTCEPNGKREEIKKITFASKIMSAMTVMLIELLEKKY